MRTPFVFAICLIHAANALAQPYGEADRGQSGDAAIQQHLATLVKSIEGEPDAAYASLEAWTAQRDARQQEYMYMLGLWPPPEKTPLQATVTGTLEGEGFVVEKLHYQSRPHLYVTANLYRPAEVGDGERLPAVLYVCGHSGMGRNGNKTAFQSHGIWFARHGYVCLVVDTLQLGEIAALHHGTYREQRWWWHSRGYTPAGVECWNGVRGIDYLISRPDVDSERIAVTGISGGGAATFWIAAADERVKVAVPVSGMADLESYVPNRVINGHCDCMFLYNAYRWPWTRIAALIAPRPMLFVNSDQDPIFPMDANDRVINRLERVYSLYGKSDLVDSVVSIGGHAYRKDIREAAYRFINIHLKGDASPVTDSEVDVAERDGGAGELPIPPEELRVFATDADLPKDELNTTIDEHFVPMAQRELPDDFEPWRSELMAGLKGVFRDVLRSPFFARQADHAAWPKVVEHLSPSVRLETENGVVITVTQVAGAATAQPAKAWMVVTNEHDQPSLPSWLATHRGADDVVYVCQTRGVGPSQWTQNNPPNYVERSHVLLGQTADTARVADVLAASSWIRAKHSDAELCLAGDGGAGILAAYAAVLSRQSATPSDDLASRLVLHRPPLSHMSADAPAVLNILRVCDVPDVLGALAPLPLTIVVSDDSEELKRVRVIYDASGKADALVVEKVDGE